MATTSGEHSPLLATKVPGETYCTERQGDLPRAETSAKTRRLGWSSAYILVISRVIGSGIWSMPGIIISEVGPGPALCLWLVGALVAWAGLAITIEYAAMLPRSGGIKVYLEYTYRHPQFLAPVLVAVHMLLLGINATNCVVFAKYILFATGTSPTDMSAKMIAVGLMTAVVITHSCFYKTGVVVQNVLGWVKIALTIFVIMAGFWVCLTQRTSDLTWDGIWADANTDWTSLSMAFFKIVVAYSGLDNITNVMDEVKNPVRTVNTAATAALWTASTMYVLLNIAFIVTVPLDEIKQDRELLAALFFRKLGFGQVLLPVTIALGAAGTVMVSTFGLARLKQEIARDGFIPFGSILASNEPFGAPMGALVLHYIPTVLFIVASPSASVLAFLGEIEGYTKQFFGLAIAVGLISLRYRQPELKRPYHAWMPSVWLTGILATFLILTPIFPYFKKHAPSSHAMYAIVSLAMWVFCPFPLCAGCANPGRSLVGLLYWYIWTIFLPGYGQYRLEEEPHRLSDGSWATKLIRRPLVEHT